MVGHWQDLLQGTWKPTAIGLSVLIEKNILLIDWFLS